MQQRFSKTPKTLCCMLRIFRSIAQLYNPSPVKMGDETILLVSVVEHVWQPRDTAETWDKQELHKPRWHKLCFGDKNFIDVQQEGMPWDLYHHFIDNRVTKIDDTYYIITPAMVKGYDSPVGMLGKRRILNL